jgi:hypothetical protein
MRTRCCFAVVYLTISYVWPLPSVFCFSMLLFELIAEFLVP